MSKKNEIKEEELQPEELEQQEQEKQEAQEEQAEEGSKLEAELEEAQQQIEDLKDKNLRIVFLALVCCLTFGSSLLADMAVDHWRGHYGTVDRRYKNFDRAVATEEVTDCDKNWQIYAPDNGGIHYAETYTLDYLGIYDDTSVSAYKSDPEQLRSDLETMCLRSDAQYLLMTVGETDDSYRSDEILIISVLPNTFDLTLYSEDGSEKTYKNVKDGDTISSGESFDFDMTHRPEAIIVK